MSPALKSTGAETVVKSQEKMQKSLGLSLNPPCVFYCRIDPCVGVVLTYTGAGVVRQRAIVGQGDVFLLPLLIQRAPAPLPQDALWKKQTKVSRTRRTKRRGCLNLETPNTTEKISSKCGESNNS